MLEKSKNLLYFEVEDTGAGIKAEVIPKLETPFSTFDNEMELNKQGIGLGLFICKKLVSVLGPNEKLFITSIER